MLIRTETLCSQPCIGALVREVGAAGMFLLSDHASGITGEILHVDCGYNVMGSPGRAIEKVKRLILSKVEAASPELAAKLQADDELKRL